MFQSIIWFISLRYLRNPQNDNFSRFIFSLPIIGTLIGIIALIIVMSVMNGLECILERNILGYIPQAIITTIEDHFNPKQYPIKNIIKLKGVKNIDFFIGSEVVLQSHDNIRIAFMNGINKKSKNPLLQYLNNIESSILTSDSYRMIIGIQLAQKLNIKIGDTIRLLVPNITQLTPIGHIPHQRLFTIVGYFITNGEADDNQVLVNDQDAARLLRYPKNDITGWRLYFYKPLDIENINQYKIPSNMIWKDWREQKGNFFQAVKMEKKIMNVLLSLIIIVAGFHTIISISLVIIKKQYEIAILQSLGMKRIKIMMIFILYGTLFGIIGTFLGIIIGIYITTKLNIIMHILGFLNKEIELPIIINYINIIYIALSSIFITFLGTLYPAWYAASIYPTRVLRYE